MNNITNTTTITTINARRAEYLAAHAALTAAEATLTAARKAESESEVREWQPIDAARRAAERAMGVASQKREESRKRLVGAIGAAWWDALHPFRVAAAHNRGRLTRPDRRRLHELQASFADLAKEARTVGAQLRPFNERRSRP